MKARHFAQTRGARHLLTNARGLSSIEYVIVLVLVVAVSIGVWQVFGQQLRCALAKADAEFSRLLGRSPEPPPQACQAGGGSGSGGPGDTFGPGTGTGPSAGSGTGPGAAGAGPGAGGPGAGNPGGGAPGGGTTPGSGATPGGSTPAAPGTPQWVSDMRAVMCPQDKAFLQDLQRRGVTVTAYDRIYYDDPYYDGTQWTTKRFEAGGSTDGTNIDMIRSGSAQEDAATIFHEGVHTGQADTMEWRDREYDAYAREEQWRIDHGLPTRDPNFRVRDASGKETVNMTAIKEMVDKEYPGVTSTPATGGPPESIVGRAPNGDTIVRRADGTEYQRPPKAGDSFPGPQITEPPGGIPIDVAALQCP